MNQCITHQGFVRPFPTNVYRVPRLSLVERETNRVARRVARPKSKERRAAPRVDTQAKAAVTLGRRLDSKVLNVLSAKTIDEFHDLTRAVFTEFMDIADSLATLTAGPKRTPSQLVDHINSCFAILRRGFSSDTHLLSSESVKNEALYCLDTLHRAHFLAQDVLECVIRGDLQTEALSRYGEAIGKEWVSIFNLCCLTYAIAHKVSINPEIFNCVMIGFRFSEDAYAAARAAMEPLYQAEYTALALAEEPEPEYSLV